MVWVIPSRPLTGAHTELDAILADSWVQRDVVVVLMASILGFGGLGALELEVGSSVLDRRKVGEHGTEMILAE